MFDREDGSCLVSLSARDSAPFRDYLKSHIFKKAVPEIGPGEQILRHRGLTRLTLGATHYLSVDLRKESEKFGAIPLSRL